MAIALDAAYQSSNDTSSPVSWTHTVGSGANRVIVVGVVVHGSFSLASCSGVTCGGTSMTKATSHAGTYIETSVWILHNPGSGNNTIEASFSGFVKAGYGCSVSYTGAQQSSTADATGGGKCTSSCTEGSKTYTVTTVADNCWIFGIGGTRGGISDTVSIAANETSRGSLDIDAYTVFEAEDSNGPLTPAGAKTPGFTLETNHFMNSVTEYAISFASFAPAAAAAGNPHYAYAQQ